MGIHSPCTHAGAACAPHIATTRRSRQRRHNASSNQSQAGVHMQLPMPRPHGKRRRSSNGTSTAGSSSTAGLAVAAAVQVAVAAVAAVWPHAVSLSPTPAVGAQLQTTHRKKQAKKQHNGAPPVAGITLFRWHLRYDLSTGGAPFSRSLGTQTARVHARRVAAVAAAVAASACALRPLAPAVISVAMGGEKRAASFRVSSNQPTTLPL